VELVPIGSFARQSGLTVKALRHYDTLGLLPPARVDPVTRHRWYAPEQLERARRIRRLRALELPLAEVRAVLAAPDRGRERLVRTGGDVEARLTRDQRILHGLVHLTEVHLTEVHLTEVHLTEVHLTEVHLTEVHLTEVHLTEVHLTELHLTELHLTELHLTEGDDMTTDSAAPPERQLAGDLFNLVWTLLEQTGRSTEDDDRMLHAAHASRYHWGQVGGPEQIAIGEWQCARVYSVLGRAEPALHHARRGLSITAGADVPTWLVASAHEGLARAYLVAGNREAALSESQAARGLLETVSDPEDRQVVEDDLATLTL